jgi:hypothetical protein
VIVWGRKLQSHLEIGFGNEEVGEMNNCVITVVEMKKL